MKLNREIFIKILEEYYANPNNKFKFVLSVDFDDCVCYSNYPLCGNSTPVVPFIRSIQRLDIILMLNTCREGEPLKMAVAWCNEQGIEFDLINENDPERIKVFGECRKLGCDLSIDDKNMNFNTDDFI